MDNKSEQKQSKASGLSPIQSSELEHSRGCVNKDGVKMEAKDKVPAKVYSGWQTLGLVENWA